jgi:signal transduction histidine kinase
MAIRGQAQLLQNHVATTTVPERQRLLDGLANIEGSTRKMTRLLNELLDVAQVRAGESLALDRQSMDLVALARQTAGEYAGASALHRITVATSLETLLGSWDPFRLERVLGNLLSNAIKYSPAGGEIVVAVRQDDPQWGILEVRDSGLGIPAADLPHIFEQYFQASNVDHVSGRGIGLAVVRQIVEQHEGSIAVQSDQGVGTTVSIRLPLPLFA